MVMPKLFGYVIEEELAGCLFTCALENWSMILSALGIEDAPKPSCFIRQYTSESR